MVEAEELMDRFFGIWGASMTRMMAPAFEVMAEDPTSSPADVLPMLQIAMGMVDLHDVAQEVASAVSATGVWVNFYFYFK